MHSNNEINKTAAFDLKDWICFVVKQNLFGGVKEDRTFFCFSLLVYGFRV